MTQATRSVVVAVSDVTVRQAVVTRLAFAGGLELEVREGHTHDVSEQDIVIVTPPDCSPRAYRELVTRGARVIVVSVASRPHREYARAGLRSYVSLRELWGETLLAAIYEAAEQSQPAVGQ